MDAGQGKSRTGGIQAGQDTGQRQGSVYAGQDGGRTLCTVCRTGEGRTVFMQDRTEAEHYVCKQMCERIWKLNRMDADKKYEGQDSCRPIGTKEIIDVRDEGQEEILDTGQQGSWAQGRQDKRDPGQDGSRTGGGLNIRDPGQWT